MLIWVAALIGTQVGEPADHCRRAAAVVPTKQCHLNPHGAVLAADAAEAARLGAMLRAGEERFQRHFGRAPVPYALIQAAAPGEEAALRGAGFTQVLGWLTFEQLQDATLASVRRGAEARATAQGLSGEQATAAAEQAVATWRSTNSRESRLAQEEGVVPHEAGHGWFIRTFWPDLAPATRTGHYGGPAPDWMDETAAILMENDEFAEQRRRGFEQVYRDGERSAALTDITAAELIDLPHFLSRTHPMAGSGSSILSAEQMRARQLSEGTNIVVMSGDEARQRGRGGLMFYLQGRMFADFLVEQTGDPQVFAQIGAALARGDTMEQWLAAAGPRHRLPTTVAALDQAWRGWLIAKFGPPGTAAPPAGTTA